MTPEHAQEVPITFKVGEKEYKLRRVNVSDVAALGEYLRDQRIDAILRNQFRVRKDGIIAQAMAYAATQDPTDDDIFVFAQSARGMKQLLFRCLQTHQPGIQLAEVDAILADQAAIGALLLSESGLNAAPEEEAESAVLADPTVRVFGGTVNIASDGAKT